MNGAETVIFLSSFNKSEVGARPGSRCDMRLSRIITDYRLSQIRSSVADEMYSTICVEWVVVLVDHFGLGFT